MKNCATLASMKSFIPRRVLLVGAYERDNFGDILFALLTRARLTTRGHQVALSSVIGADMRANAGYFVHPYEALLGAYDWDAVWVVGGEVGNATVGTALRQSLEPETSRAYATQRETAGNAENLAHLLGAPAFGSLAYVPNLGKCARNADSSLILNSVGGFRANSLSKSLGENDRHQDFVFRDRSSFDVFSDLAQKNIGLAPDLVHSLPDYYTFNPVEERYILFQVSETIAHDHDLDAVGRSLAQIAREQNCALYLFPAGEAPGHDSLEDYRNLQSAVASYAPSQKVSRISERNPVALAGWIANAQAWIGSSLHGRIISSTYGVPRVSLDKQKVNAYCQEWDEEMPHSVQLTEIGHALSVALAGKATDSRGQELRMLARENFNALAEAMGQRTPRSTGPPPTEAALAHETIKFLRRRVESTFLRSKSL